MDPPTRTESMEDRKNPSEPTKSLDAEIEEKRSVDSALPAGLISAGSQHLHRRLGGKEIQLFAVGGAIGTCMESSNFPLLKRSEC